MDAEQKVESSISGFWRRIGALVLDGLFLGGLGFLLGLFFESWFVSLGDAARLIGFSIALCYFGILNSRIGQGQTLGKRALDIKVVNRSGDYISPLRSVVRYVVFATPFYLNGLNLSPEFMEGLSIVHYLLAIVIFGGIFSTAYLYLFNKRTRQSLHDLVVGSYVVQAEGSFQSSVNVWKPHFAIISTLPVVTVVVMFFMEDMVAQEPFKKLLNIQVEVLNVPSVRKASVVQSERFVSSSTNGEQSFEFVNVSASLTENNISDQTLSKNISDIVFDLYPASREMDAVNVTLTYGYDIGIWSTWSRETRSYNFSNSETQ
ncbi:RDD family protein [Litoribrevibacter albus]|nr:RDD family protein [Litoribrevibacter albus]